MILNLIAVVEASPAFLGKNYAKILPILANLMKNTSETSIRLDVIKFYLCISQQLTDTQVILEVSEIIIPALESPVNDSFYKIVSEALRVLSILIEKGAKPNQEMGHNYTVNYTVYHTYKVGKC